jgi:hypothetical protein
LGAPTLKQLAMKQMLSDQRNLTPALFSNVPWRIASHLWDYLHENGNTTMYMWKLLSTAYPTEFWKASAYWQERVTPVMPIKDYLGLVNDDSVNWRVALTLATEFATIPELVQIANVKNVVALEISTQWPRLLSDEDNTQITSLADRIIRTWSELSQTSRAFKHLKILKLYGQQHLTGLTFEYLDSFPSLSALVVGDCKGMISKPVKRLAATYGWETEKRPRLERRDEDVGFDESATVYQCYRGIVGQNEQKRASVDQGIPILDFQIGPRYPRSSASVVTVFLREPSGDVEAANLVRKRKMTSNIGTEPRLKERKPVMKNVQGKDIKDLLAEFS